MEAFFAEADAISLHMRLVDEMRGIATGDDLARMKVPDALLINTSRAIDRSGRLVSPPWRRAGLAWQRLTYTKRASSRSASSVAIAAERRLYTHIGYVACDEYELQLSDISIRL